MILKKGTALLSDLSCALMFLYAACFSIVTSEPLDLGAYL